MAVVLAQQARAGISAGRRWGTPDTHSQCLWAWGVGGGKPTRKGLTPRRKSSAAPWSVRGCQQLRLCLGLVRALVLIGGKEDGPGAKGTVSLLLP